MATQTEILIWISDGGLENADVDDVIWYNVPDGSFLVVEAGQGDWPIDAPERYVFVGVVGPGQRILP